MPSCVVALDSISGLTNDAMDGQRGQLAVLVQRICRKAALEQVSAQMDQSIRRICQRCPCCLLPVVLVCICL